MINIGPLHPPVNTRKTYQNVFRDAAVAGSEVNKDAPKVAQNPDRRRKKDRRQRKQKPLIDLRSGKDRRENPDMPSIDIEV